MEGAEPFDGALRGPPLQPAVMAILAGEVRMARLRLSAAHALERTLDSVLHDILACAPQALAATKALVSRARHHDAQQLVAEAAHIFSQSAASAEGLEGLTAFVQKRKPHWAAP